MKSTLSDGSSGQTDMHAEGEVTEGGDFRLQLRITSVDPLEGPFEDIGEFTVIGDKAWKRLETDSWIETDTNDPVLEIAEGFVPLKVLEFYPADYLRIVAGVQADAEVVDGTGALHFEIAPTAEELEEPVPPEIAAAFFGGGELAGDQPFTMNLWITPNYHRLLKLQIAATFAPERIGELFPEDVPEGTVMDYTATVSLTRHNDSNIEVKPPITAPGFRPFANTIN